jgi:hypothetical protein
MRCSVWQRWFLFTNSYKYTFPGVLCSAEARTLSKITDTMPGASCVLFTLSFYDYELDADGNEAIVR